MFVKVANYAGRVATVRYVIATRSSVTRMRECHIEFASNVHVENEQSIFIEIAILMFLLDQINYCPIVTFCVLKTITVLENGKSS